MSTQLGPYTLGEVIGSGSFATVHRATDERFGTAVAVKILADDHTLDLDVRERFLGEARALRRIGSDHCILVHDIGETPGRHQPYLVMELADRGTLDARVASLRTHGWRATRGDLLMFARSLATGVDAVHSAGLVHRDLSPGNLLLTAGRGDTGVSVRTDLRADGAPVGRIATTLIAPDERLLLADLGLFKDLAQHSGLTVGAGTSGFRPPEQERLGMVDIRADVWAMSALLAWLADEARLTAEQSERLGAMLVRGTAASPDDRPSDAAAWLREVEDALRHDPPPTDAPGVGAGSGIGAGTSTGTGTGTGTGTDAGTGVGRRRSRIMRSAMAAALALALLVGGWAGWRLGDDTPPAAADGASVAISGPSEVAVGETAVFTAEVEGADSWAWTLPTGRFVADREQVSVTPTSAGRAVIVLRSTAPDGTDIRATYSFRVVAE
ncbi:protein kinase domain-containing protein [Brachybacterium sp. DNPG3]